MKTAVALAIDKVDNSSIDTYSCREVLEMLKEAQIIQDGQLKIAYLHGRISVLSRSEMGGDEYFAKEFNESL